MLTATPHQGEANHSRFKNLRLLLDDDIDFSSLEEDCPLLPAIGGSKKFTDLVIRTPKQDVTDAEGRKVFKGRQTHRMPVKMYADEKTSTRPWKSTSGMDTRCWSGMSEGATTGGGFLLTTFQKLNASSTAAIKAALQGTAHAAAGRDLRSAAG